MLDKKMSEFTEINSLPDIAFIPVVDETNEPKLNRKISKENLILALNGTSWLNLGQFTIQDFQAGNQVDGNPNIYEIVLDPIAELAIPSAVALRNDLDLSGPSLTEENIELLNDSNNFILGNLLENWMEGDNVPNIQLSQISYKEKSGKLFDGGIVLKLRLTTDIAIADLTEGKFTLLIKLESLPFDSES